jgi:ectoine hydroxylase-related dioxygenase (phytanoyl-CoA dioxygenase family)
MTELPSTVRGFPGMEQRALRDDVDRVLEEIQVLGYSVLEGVMSPADAAETHDQLVRLWKKQENEFGRERLLELGEHGTHRGLLCEDDRYLRMASNSDVLAIVRRLVGETGILNLQNASAAFPHVQHFQSAFHRDFAKDFVASKLLSVNAFWCIDDFNEKSGATQVVPFSHAAAILPSEAYIAKHSITIQAPAGSVIFWDSLLLHRTGYNSTDRPRFGINHMYTRPFLKQQMDFPEYLKGKIDVDSKLGQLLGFWTIPPKSVREFRVDPAARTYRGGQG